MEPVDLNFIEQTADFMFHLSSKQLIERVQELKVRQYGIHNIIVVTNANYKNQEQIEYVFRMALIIVRVMESYEVKIPIISTIFIKQSIKAELKADKDKKRYLSEEEKLAFNIAKIGQPYYIDYLKEMVNTDEKYHELFTKEESHNNYFCMTTIALIYALTIKRYS